MKTKLFLFFTLVVLGNVFGQELEFSILASEPAYCRTSGDQNGGGILYCSATGGVPDYDYSWRDLTTGEIINNSTWGGRNPGCYEITVIDLIGTVIKDTICIDSLNPIANMAVISDDVLGGPVYFTGTAPASIVFDNLSLNVPDDVGPPSMIRYYFKPTGASPEETATSITTDFMYTYEYGGIWTASLVAENINGCRDTAYLSFTIDGPSELDEPKTSEIYIISNAGQQMLQINGEFMNVRLYVYNLNGQIVTSYPLANGFNMLNFNQPNGLYLYEIRDEEMNVRVSNGTFVF